MFDIPQVQRTTQLYTKTFNQETWDKLDFPLPEMGYSMTMQKFLKLKYNIVIEEKIEDRREEIKTKDFLTKSLLEKLIKENKVLVKNGNQIKKKFLLYAEMDHREHLIEFANSIEFKESSITQSKKNPRAI